MNTPSPASRLLSTLVLCTSAIVVQAQLVFIPDVQMRAWLNMVIDGVVDGAGYMDSAHPGIPSITNCYTNVDWDPVDLTGLEYLTGIDTLRITFEDLPYTSVTFNALPPTLSRLTINSYPAAILPPLPGTLRSLSLYGANNITNITSWPPELEYLDLQYASALTNLAPLPSSMNVVGLRGLTSLTDLTGVLPDTITGTLNMEYLPQLAALPLLPHFAEDDTLILSNLALIEAIPPFPDHIEFLQLHTLPLVTSLAAFPVDLEELELISLDGLGLLPQFPSTIYYILLSGLPLVNALPTLPDSLQLFYIGYLPLLECLPTVPPSADILSVFNSGVDCVPNIPPGLTTNLQLCGFYNAGNCPFYSPSVSGTGYHDLNANGARDAGEPGVGYTTVDIAPGNTITGVMNNGFYAQALDAGTYTITPNVNNPYVTSISPASHSAVLMNVSDVDSLNDFGLVLQANVQDLVVDLTEATPARPGFNNTVQLTYGNQGTIGMSGTVTFNFDTDQNWNSSSPPPDMLTGNTATWNLVDLVIGEQEQIVISLYTDPAVLMGTPVTHTAVADPVITDQTPTNNVDSITAQVLGSYDPNDKTVSPPEMTSSQVASGERLTYTIRFQNTGTYQADRVIITDTLSTDLQWNTMNLIASSHPCTWYIHDGTLRITFDPIVLPDSTSDEPGSHGFITFSMVPVPVLLNGMQVANTANIFFDFNPPVITNEALLTVNDALQVESLTASGLMLWPNPVEDRLIIALDHAGANALLEVMDLTGRVVMRTAVVGNRTTLDVRSLSSGSYLVRVDGTLLGRFVRR